MVRKDEFEKNIPQYNLTAWQRKWCEERNAKPDFKQWVWTVGKWSRPPGTVTMPYYTNDGILHVVVLGKDKVEMEIHSGMALGD